jgi:hypothetical protein
VPLHRWEARYVHSIDSVVARDHGMAQLMKYHRGKNQSDEDQSVQAPNADYFVSDKENNEKQEQKGDMNLEWYSQDRTDFNRPFH